MKAAMLSIRPKWCAKIANGEKTIEVRKTKPKMETPFKCYIYQTKPKYGDWNERDGSVIGEFVCDKILDIAVEISSPDDLLGYPFPGTALTDKQIMGYLGSEKTGYGWHISNLEIYETPKELSEFYVEDNRTFDCPSLKRMKRPPQSWCYVEE